MSTAHLSFVGLVAALDERLERIASRLVLCRQAQRAIETAELRWAALLNG